MFRVPLMAAAIALIAAVGMLSAGSGRPASAANGTWTGKYYNNTSLSGSAVVTRDDGATLDFGYDGVTAPAPGVNPTDFSVSWSRSDTYAAGAYRFTATADDGIHVYVDGTLIIDQFVDQGRRRFSPTSG